MSGIQLILLLSVGFLGTYITLYLKKRILDVLVLLIMIGTAATFILRPDVTSAIAKKLGVGRGADMIFYISILIFWFVILKLYARLRKMEQKFTDLIRHQALSEAINLSNDQNDTKK